MDAVLKNDVLEEENAKIEAEASEGKIEIDETLQTVKDNPNKIEETVETE